MSLETIQSANMDNILNDECSKIDVPVEKSITNIDIENEPNTNQNEDILKDTPIITEESKETNVSNIDENMHNINSVQCDLIEDVNADIASDIVPTKTDEEIIEIANTESERFSNDNYSIESSSEILPLEEPMQSEPTVVEVVNTEVVNNEVVDFPDQQVTQVPTMEVERNTITSDISEAVVLVVEESPPTVYKAVEQMEIRTVGNIEVVTSDIIETVISEDCPQETSETPVTEIFEPVVIETVDSAVTETIEIPTTETIESAVTENSVNYVVTEPVVNQKVTKNPSAPGPVPLITESILSALSEIHGEKAANISNGVPSRNSRYYEMTPGTLAKVASENKLFHSSARQKMIRPVTKRGQPALNDKQLLAILQDGSEPSPSPFTKDYGSKVRRGRSLEAVQKQIVLKQLSEFPSKKKKNKSIVKTIKDVKIPRVIKKKNITPTKEPSAPIQTSTPTPIPSCTDISSIISDWTDDEVMPGTPVSSHPDIVESSINTTANSLTDTSMSNNTNPNDSTTINGEAFVKPKRVSRIIKKKIIYDPDNPETFKFASDIVQAAVASAEIKQAKAAAESKHHKVQATENKQNKTAASESAQSKTPVVVESKQIKSVTPESKQAKSPNESKTPTKIATKRRLTEIDKLLMDEGAVNMLYQMEQSNKEGEDAPQEQKKKKKLISNEKKLKLIKKSVINQSKTNVDQPVKVFRVRKDKVDPSSNNSSNSSKVTANAVPRASMQSPSLSEMSGVSVNESRIIRRHSSSSFSSGCMSPRPQSPVGDVGNKSLNSTTDSGIHNKTVKRKGTRQKKASKSSDKTIENSFVAPITPVPDVTALQMKSFTQLSMDVSDNITHIIVNPTGNKEELYDYQVITELTAAVKLCTGSNAVLLSSAEDSLCGGLDLRGILQPTPEKQRHYAEQLLDAFRELMVTLCECRSALVCCVGGACTGPGVALLTVCDLALASDRATFCVTPRLRRKLPPEGAALLTRPYSLPLHIGRELVLCGRKLTATEALQRGIVSRTLWPDRFIEEVRSIVGDLTQHPSESFSIMKNILRRGEVTAVTSALRHEGRLLIDYWCSPAGQNAIREVHAHLER